MERNDAPMRELFVEELAEVKGGVDPIDKILQWVRDQFVTTGGCNEEGPQC